MTPACFEPAQLLAGDGHHTLYLCAPAHDQRRLRGYFTALTQHVLTHAFECATRAAASLDPPLLVVLDEAAHIAPLAELDALAATCASHGIQLVTIWQDLAQIRGRYGARAPTVLNNHRAKLFLPGIADPDTLEYASRLVGDEEATQPSVTRDPTGRRSTTRRRRRAACCRPRNCGACRAGRPCSSTGRSRRPDSDSGRGGLGAAAGGGWTLRRRLRQLDGRHVDGDDAVVAQHPQ